MATERLVAENVRLVKLAIVEIGFKCELGLEQVAWLRFDEWLGLLLSVKFFILQVRERIIHTYYTLLVKLEYL
jgi:hypothetical protein